MTYHVRWREKVPGPRALQSLLLAIDQRDPAVLRDALLEITDDSPDIDAQSLERSLGRLMARNLSPELLPDAEAFADIFRIVPAYGVSVPPEIALVFRTLATLQGRSSGWHPGSTSSASRRAFLTPRSPLSSLRST